MYSGLRWAFGFEVLSNVTVPVAREFVLSIDAMGIYPLVKIIEIIVGTCLVFNRVVPFVLIVELPISITIFWLNTFIVAAPRQLFSGPQELILNTIMLVFYGQYYLPLLRWRAEEKPLWRAGDGMLAQAALRRDGVG